MVIPAAAGVITFIFTTLLTIAGVGAAFILIPVFIALGIDLHVAMATALLINSIAMIFASYRFVQKKLILWRVAVPILIVATALSPLGAYVSKGLNREVLLWLFTGFLLFAAGMMLFYEPGQKNEESSKTRQMTYGVAVGGFAGFMGGLLGVGGGNFIVPVLVWLGFDSKKASATTSFIVIFSSFSGFLGHASLGNISFPLLGFTAAGSALGAVAGAWLMTDKLNRRQVKLTIGIVLLIIAAKMIWDLAVKF
ncbi:MAG: sulfite exporter TauE/SafE family protein [Desulfococcaceae bacterium]